jgi:hypothetical protein
VDLYAHGETEITVAGSTSGFLLQWSHVITLLVLYLCIYVGLLWFKRWARTLLAVAMALSLVEPFLYRQTYPCSGIEEILSNLSDYLDGALLTLAWATALRVPIRAQAVMSETRTERSLLTCTGHDDRWPR